jgi:SET domain-containing protein
MVDLPGPYSKQFVHSVRSKIQGLGLYAARDIEKHTMVIEYIGEMIREKVRIG